MAWSDAEQAEIDALARAAEEQASRRRFLSRSAAVLIWAMPVIETLVVVPEAWAQTHGGGHTHVPMMMPPGKGMM